MRRIIFFVLINMFFCFSCLAQNTVYEIDLTHGQIPRQVPLNFSGESPSGTTLSVNSRYFERNGKPWFPMMGEMHYNRVPAQNWETEIVKMKSAGLSIIATYVFWNEHELAKGQWDWKNNRDLRHFLQLCANQKMLVWLRIGPWSHGEQLNGGFPDWVQQMKGHRSNNPEYLKESTTLFNQIGQQTNGMYFNEGGPVIGVQLENEYASGQAEHISKLKEIAQQANIKPVYWSVTANTVFDDNKMEVIPLQGSYAYRGWEKAGGGATKDFLYGDDQWIMTDAIGKVFYDVTKFPKGLCEQGAGSQMTYPNRFVVAPEVVEAHLQNQIGRGMNLIGYYMFHGGTQTPGLKEPGLPESYDFQAPISEFGLLRPSYKYLKILHSFVNDFGTDLAKMTVFEPENPVRNEMDTKNLRYVARANGSSGFLFLGNTQVRVTMPDKTVTMRVNLPGETINFPSIIVKGQTTAILPFNLKAGAAIIKYVTAQPLARIITGKNITLFFQQLPGVKPQVAIDANTIKTQNFKGWQSRMEKYQLRLKAIDKADITFSDTRGNTITLVFLTRQQAENAWRIKLKQHDALLITTADVLAENKKITLQQINSNDFKWQVYPRALNAFANSKPSTASTNSLFDNYQFKVQSYVSTVSIKYPQKQNAVINVPARLPANLADIILNVDYLGGSCKLIQQQTIKTDNLFNGTTWQIGLNRFIGNGNVTLNIEDWNDEITGLPGALVNSIKSKGSIFKSITASPQYQTILSLNN
ncbi:Glycosyl hydrolases family 35 [Mucilaginibacter pineti]|uniref:Beta-galactosidase n=1 Tax=Mucilaginibacter pineti TaxID=1391627 RepID=A0A1G7LNM9_9SPHI|nr:beta-galactosidase [Mucilaginibacter pineti]SDF50620.1 Glycosyl hydrolases family 35 [Mucilaginibacter pineti]